jgi:predicted amidohydrolase YtcJ
MPGLPFPGPTAEQALAAVEQAAKTRTDWVTAYIGPLIARDRRNWRKALDVVAPNTPVFFRAFWGHTSIVNGEGLRRLGISEEIADPLGGWWGRDETGHLDGRAYEAAETITPLIRPATAEHLATSFGEAQQRYARWGVTSIYACRACHCEAAAKMDGLFLGHLGNPTHPGGVGGNRQGRKANAA